MNILIASPSYPSKDNLYSYMFVHARAKSYINLGHKVNIIKFHEVEQSRTYNYDGVDVIESTDINYISTKVNFKPDCLAVHSPKGKGLVLIPEILSSFKINSVTWIHLEEAINLWRRWFELNTFKKFFRFVIRRQFGNLLALAKLRKYLQTEDKKGNKIVFVSKWLKNTVTMDLLLPIKNSYVIPNPIDTSIFKFHEKNNKAINRILMIRSFSTRKYATDIAIKIINKLNSKKKNFSIDIYGDGEYFEKDIGKIEDRSNVNVYQKFLDHSEMNRVMKDYGFLLIPTRQDSHGVTMCEAMSAGLIAIVNNNTAIPEYLDNNKGILFQNINEAVDKIISLSNDQIKFNKISKNASKYVDQNINSTIIAKKELAVLKSISN